MGPRENDSGGRGDRDREKEGEDLLEAEAYYFNVPFFLPPPSSSVSSFPRTRDA